MSKIEVDAVEPQSGTTLTLGASGDTVALAAGATSSGFGASGAVNWDTTAKTANFTAVSGEGYFVDTNTTAITVTLPATPAAGDIVAIADYNGTAGTNNITVGRNSSNINGSATDFKISINYASISFVYVDATAGWRSVDISNTISVQNQFVSATGGTITTCGDFKIHSFTGPGTFTVTNAGTPAGSTTVDYLVVAGGGGGAKGTGGGGGGGGHRSNFPSPAIAGLPVTAQAYPITVGGGGTGSTTGTGGNGNQSIFSTITSTGGGGGGDRDINTTGQPGGSGGGGSGSDCAPGNVAGTGNTPPTSPSQGNNGGTGRGTASNSAGGGGGGAGVVGSPSPSNTVAGAGGAGSANSITGSSITRAGGGGGGGHTPTAANGGTGGGGAGGILNSAGSAVAGTPNTGGGGGGGAGGTGVNGGAGGSGIVIIRYKFQ